MYSLPMATQHQQVPILKGEKRYNGTFVDRDNGQCPSIKEMKMMERKKRERIAEIHERTQAPPPERFTIQKVKGPDRNLLGLLGSFDNFPKTSIAAIDLMGIDQHAQPLPPAIPAHVNKVPEPPTSYMPPPLPIPKVEKPRPDKDPRLQSILHDIHSLRPPVADIIQTPMQKTTAPLTNGVYKKHGSHDTHKSLAHAVDADAYISGSSSEEDDCSPRKAAPSRFDNRKASLSAASSASSSESSSSSGSGSESSSDEAEPENPARTRSSSPATATSWSLERIFKQPVAGKDDANPDLSRVAPSRADPAYDILPHSPYNTDLAPPVVTKEPPSSRQNNNDRPASLPTKQSSTGRKSRSPTKPQDKTAKPVKKAGRAEKDFQSVAVLPTDSESSDEEPSKPLHSSPKSSRAHGPKKLAGLKKPGSKFPTPPPRSKTCAKELPLHKSTPNEENTQARKSTSPSTNFVCSLAVNLLKSLPKSAHPSSKGTLVNSPQIAQIRTSPQDEDQKKQRAIASIYKSTNKKSRTSDSKKSKEDPKPAATKTDKKSRKQKRSPSPDTRRVRPRQDADAIPSTSRAAFIVPSTEPRAPSSDIKSPAVPSEEIEVSPAARYSASRESTPVQVSEETQLLDRAKELKHMADTETNRFMQIVMYLEAGLYFIITGESMVNEEARSKNAMYSDTFKFIRHVSSIIMREELMNNTTNATLAILSLWCQSIICMKQYHLNRAQDVESQRKLAEYFKDPSLQSAMDSFNSAQANPLPNQGAPWDRQPSPPSMASTPSPADSNSSGYSTETKLTGTNSHPVPLDIMNIIHNHLVMNRYHSDGWTYWNDAQNILSRYEVKGFFAVIDREVGPVTIQSSARHLFVYVKNALDKLRRIISVKFPQS